MFVQNLQSICDSLSDVSSSDEEFNSLHKTYSDNDDDKSNSDLEDQTDQFAFRVAPISLSDLLRRRNHIYKNNQKYSKVLPKYWRRRYDFFERFDLGIQLDEESWYSVTPESIARHQSKTCGCDVIVDAFAGVGGNTIQFAQTCGLVIAIENCFPRLLMLLNNAQIYGVHKNIMPICGDVMSIFHCLRNPLMSLENREKQDEYLPKHSIMDTIFMSPPWSLPDYTQIVFPPGSSSWNQIKRQKLLFSEIKNEFEPIKNLQEIPLLHQALVNARHLCEKILIYLPRNSSIGQLLQLGWPCETFCENGPLCSCKKFLDVNIETYCLRGRNIALGIYLGSFCFDLDDRFICANK